MKVKFVHRKISGSFGSTVEDSGLLDYDVLLAWFCNILKESSAFFFKGQAVQEGPRRWR